jgi:hypothetical protein
VPPIQEMIAQELKLLSVEGRRSGLGLIADD